MPVGAGTVGPGVSEPGHGGGGTGWPATNGTGAGNLEAETGAGDATGYNFTDQGTGGFNVTETGNGVIELKANGSGSIGILQNGTGQLSLITVGPSTHITLSTPEIFLTAPVVMMSASLPTSDPHVAHQLWNNGGVLTISAG